MFDTLMPGSAGEFEACVCAKLARIKRDKEAELQRSERRRSSDGGIAEDKAPGRLGTCKN